MFTKVKKKKFLDPPKKRFPTGCLLFISGCLWTWRTGSPSPGSPSWSPGAVRTACAATRARAARPTSRSAGWSAAASATTRPRTATPVTASQRKTARRRGGLCTPPTDLRYSRFCDYDHIDRSQAGFFVWSSISITVWRTRQPTCVITVYRNDTSEPHFP